MVTITWTVKPNGLHTTTVGNNKDFVVHVEYTITGTDGVNTAAIDYAYSFDVLGETFTPFENLSEAQVVAWAQEKLGPEQLTNLQLGMEQHLKQIANPPAPVLPKAVPWSN